MSRTFLIIDRDTSFREGAAAALRKSGHIVLEAGNGAQARAALEMCVPDYLVMDGVLPDVDGLRWLERHRSLFPGARFVFTSVFWSDAAGLEQLTRQLGWVRVMLKPLSPLEFGQSMLGLLRPAKAKPAPAASQPRPPGSSATA